MARLSRYVLPGYPQHVIQRGNNRQAIFADDEDQDYFLELLRDGAGKCGCDIHAYVLMSNHIHLLLTPREGGGIGRLFQHLGRYYVPYFNHRHRRTGTLWEGRYRATVIDADSYLLTLYRYIELNPVRANMVKHPRDYPGSSYRANARGRADGIVAPHPVYDALGPNPAARQAAYRQLFRRRIGAATLDEIRAATNKGWVLGTDRFRKAVEQVLDRPTAPRPKGGDRRSEAYRQSID